MVSSINVHYSSIHSDLLFCLYLKYIHCLESQSKEVGTTLEICLLIRIIPYYLVRVLFGTAIPTSIFQFISIVFYTCLC